MDGCSGESGYDEDETMKTRNKILIGVALAALVVMISFYIYLPILLFGPIEPLHFSIHNNDADRHNIAVEVFDSGNKSIFKETYELVPKERTDSPEITKRRGKYMFKVTLDDKITRTYRAKVDYAWYGVRIDIYSRDPSSGEADIQICRKVV